MGPALNSAGGSGGGILRPFRGPGASALDIDDNDKRRRWPLHVAGYWLVFLFAFALGMFLYARQIWPYGLVQEIGAFLQETEEENLDLADAIANDLGGVPGRHLITPRTPFDRDPGRDWVALSELPLREERESPQVYLSPDALPGYRLIHGTFAFEDRLHGAVLLGPDGDVVRHWRITQEDVEWDHRPDANVVPHGIDITRNGSLIYAFDGGTSIRRVSWCGEPEWIVKGGFHHSVDLNEDGQLWSWGQVETDRPFGAWMIRLDPDTGAILQKMHLRELINANRDIATWGILKMMGIDDAWHHNDVEALSAAQAGGYPDFEAGDLLASYRNINLVFVFDPETQRVKWWRQGLVRRQHDPDFNDRGTISIYDNNTDRGLSRIVDIDPVSYEHSVPVPGEDHQFYSFRRGKHQELPDGSWLIASTEQGRAFEVGPGGEVRFEFLNVYDAERFLAVSEALWLPPDWFADLPECPAPPG